MHASLSPFLRGEETERYLYRLKWSALWIGFLALDELTAIREPTFLLRLTEPALKFSQGSSLPGRSCLMRRAEVPFFGER